MKHEICIKIVNIMRLMRGFVQIHFKCIPQWRESGSLSKVNLMSPKYNYETPLGPTHFKPKPCQNDTLQAIQSQAEHMPSGVSIYRRILNAIIITIIIYNVHFSSSSIKITSSLYVPCDAQFIPL